MAQNSNTENEKTVTKPAASLPTLTSSWVFWVVALVLILLAVMSRTTGGNDMITSNTTSAEATLGLFVDKTIEANDALTDGDIDLAYNLFKEASRLDPDSAETLANMGYLKIELGDESAAIEHWNDASRLYDQQGDEQAAKQLTDTVKQVKDGSYREETGDAPTDFPT